MGKPCKCGRGHASAYDNKCGYCRTLSEERTKDITAKKYDIQVLNRHHGHTGIYIGRGTPLGNPYVIDSFNGRESSLRNYRYWLLKNQNTAIVAGALNQIADQAMMGGPVKLICSCKPKDCHGDIIREVVLQALNKAGNP